MERGRLRLAAGSHLHLIFARQSQRTARPFAVIKSAGRFDRIIVMKIPRETIHPFGGGNGPWRLDLVRPFRRLVVFLFLLAREMAHDLSLGVENIEGHLIFRSVLEILIEDSD